MTTTTTITRRSANYQPSIWNHDFVQSLKSDYTKEIYTKRAEKLKEEVRRMFFDIEASALSSSSSSSSTSLLKLINTIQRLGVSYHFDDEIKGALDRIMSTSIQDKVAVSEEDDDQDLFTRALKFRLLRQHGYEVSQGDDDDDLKAAARTVVLLNKLDDVEGMLSLYEASFYGFEGEKILDEAQELTSRILKEYLNNNNNNNNNNKGNKNYIKQQLVSHALELPLHWMMPRVEARWFIDTYEQMMIMQQQDHEACSMVDPLLLEFAKLDFNMVQAIYQDDLKFVSRWWEELGFTEALSFTRDRWVEHFFWSVGFHFDPKFGNYRRRMTKAGCLVTTIDDIYDVYGSLDELELFTNAVERWDINLMGGLPHYMKILFLALYNITNEIAYEILKMRGLDVIQHLKNSWAHLCKAYLVEAKWYYSGYTPTLEEYLENGWISVSGPTLAAHAYFLLGTETTEEGLEYIKNNSSDLIRSSFIITRLVDDLETSRDELKRGDVPKSVECYMHQAGVSESIAREHIKHLINEMWKKMNQDKFSRSIFPRPFIDTMANVARMTHCTYQYGDGHGLPDRETKGRIMSIVVKPIPISS
ncbi:Terpene synthase [Macleaya cordata]|uniref:Terpene synthase n=1 Tax=Macleaya cordata TaxID=56857 RepID=A0A200QX08_MACCD|nr:Terpene synthase [Macleaya cordata]